MIKRTVLVRLAVGYSVAALLCSTTLGMAHDAAGRPDNRPVNVGVVRQAHVDPHTVILPVVDGKDIRFTRLSTEDGLSQTMVWQIVQDDQGFMWFGSQYGLNRYDGYKFKVFRHEPGVANSLSGVYIYSLFKDRSGTLWVGCDDFLDKFNPVTETFTHYRIDTAGSQGETVPVTTISQDHTGLLWLGTRKGLYRFDPSTGRIIHYRHDPNNPLSLSSDEIRTTGEDREGIFWVGTHEGLDAFDRDSGKVTLHVPLENLAPTSFYEDRFGVFWIFQLTGGGLGVFDRKTNTVTRYSFHKGHLSDALLTGVMTAFEDREGTLWFGTYGDGLVKYDRQGQKFIRYRNDPANPDSLSEDNVITLFQDREGDIWTGMFMLAPNRFSTRPPLFEKFKHEPGNPNSLKGTMVNGIYQDRKGILWISTIDALNRIDRNTGQYTFYQTAGPGVSPRPIAIVEDRSGFLWLGSDSHGVARFDPKTGALKTFRHSPTDRFSLSNDVVDRLLIDHNGTLWATTFDGLNRFDPATSHFTVYKPDKQSGALVDIEIEEDRQGELWVGTHSSGLQRFDPTTGRFTAIYQHDANDPTSLSNNRVNSVHIDHAGTMWVGTQDGLDRFDPKTGRFKTYDEQDGLSGNVVSCILDDERGNLWMSTNNGLSQFDTSKQTFRNYSAADGLPGADLTGWGTCFKSSSGEMFFGGFSGGIAFHPDKVGDSPYVPPVVLTDFRLFNHPVTIGTDSPLRKSIGYTSAFTLSHDQNVFSLEFSALSYFNSATNRYRYKLDGLDHEWHEVGSNQRLATYTTLPTRMYTFRVQGATSRGAWSEPGLELAIKILPPWWNTWWFRAVCVIVSVTLLGAFYRWRIRQLRREEKHLRDVVETIPAMAFSARSDGSTEFVNRPWLDYTGLSERANLDSGLQLTIHPDDLDEHLSKWQASLATGAPFENEARHRDANGAYRWFLVRAVPFRDEHGHVLKWYGTLTDIEDRKRSEQEREKVRQLQADLAHENRISMMGELAASLSHELRQPITAAMLNAASCLGWLTRDRPDVEEAREAASRIMKDGTRATEIIDGLRSLYKKGAPPERGLVDVNELVLAMFVLLRSEANRYSIHMRANLASQLPPVTADRVQLQQVLMNLMLNGIEAMKDTGGELMVKTELAQDGQLLLSVSDTGVGLPADKTDQIFSAFFTTKPQGSGMGLAISRTIIESHGGRLWANANQGRGATFLFTLPVEMITSSPSVCLTRQ
ncbi:sensor histidine kinase [Acidicapsa acidisoli]|uniref:sensor histidine kinase n=1 Tax=Acidicapsa acidisoli TaxID=1615681 RepID=UPI0021E050C9|nr:two-component regulator propeller domain-containing protein [Acidicapsa acidisoli]